MNYIYLRYAFWPVSLICIFLTSCSSIDSDFSDKKSEDIYSIAMQQMHKKDYQNAAKIFLEVERHYPYSDFAVKSQLYSAYAYYEAGKYDDALEAFSSFVQLHPGHADVAYAIYMMGMCSYEQIPIVQRDQEDAESALNYFEDLIKRFPETDYAKDARLKNILIRDHLAAKEMNVGRYYVSRYSYIAAINRFKLVVEQYEQSTQIEEALFRLVEAYKALHLKDQAQIYYAILQKNYPNSTWHQSAKTLMN